MNTAKLEAIDYQADARERLAKCGGTLAIHKADKKSAPWCEDGRYRPHYRCTLTGPGGSYSFDFWASVHDGQTGAKATEYDVLACLAWNTPETFKGFCDEFGDSEDSIRAHKTWKACLAQTRALERIFPSETARETLAEIQ